VSPELEAAERAVHSGQLLDSVEAAIGALR
jgi:hypothetical protein